MQELNKNLFEELQHHAEENIWVRVVTILIVIEHMKIKDLLKGERNQGQNGRPPDRRSYEDRGYSRRGYSNQDGRPPGGERPPDGNRGPPDDGGPLGDG